MVDQFERGRDDKELDLEKSRKICHLQRLLTLPRRYTSEKLVVNLLWFMGVLQLIVGMFLSLALGVIPSKPY